MLAMQINGSCMMVTLPYTVKLPQPGPLGDCGARNISKTSLKTICKEAENKRYQHEEDNIGLHGEFWSQAFHDVSYSDSKL